ncbi:MAG TPA: AMP-binding protein [Jatrophihabitans sp.]|nr:AMP-binding protein [Jatrophihabitans sp.]
MWIADQARGLTNRAATEAASAVSLLRAGAFGLEPPQRLLYTLQAMHRIGPLGAALTIACQRRPAATAIIDERGELSFAELADRSDRLAVALLARGFRTGDGIGILCRNHRGMFDALFAAAKLGARTVLLNTDFGGPQLADVCQHEQVSLLVHDEEFSATAADCRPALGSLLAWTDGPPPPDSIEGLLGSRTAGRPPAPARSQRIVLLTSGTTGAPKGAARDFGLSLAIPGGYLSKIELRAERPVYVSVPVFHAWGLLSCVVALALADTLVLARRTEPVELARSLAEHRCDALITVPVLLGRLIGLLESQAHPLPDLRVIAVSGSTLPADLAQRTRAVLGDVLHNLYGSTEVAYASIATPADLAAAPGTVGRPPVGTTIRLLDDDGRPVPRGQRGRIFVGNSFQFGHYTGGGSKQRIGGLMATGDVGHLDAAGRLFVDGRDDDMIVSGGENVYPGEVEELLLAHPQILDAAVLPVPDADFGQRLRAFVVLMPGADLNAEAVRDHVKARLARFKVPRDVLLRDAIPRNPAGKVARQQLPLD